jgi:Na+/melibiose symporter-like transporter
LLFAFYLTEVCGMAPQAMATVLAASLFASGLMDILVGHYLRERTRSVRAAATVQLAGAIGSGVTFFLFLTTALVSGSQRVVFALAIGLAFRLAYAFYDVPQNAILGLAIGNDRLRTSLSSLRFVCSGLASLSIAATAPLLLTAGRQTEWFAALGCGVCIIGISSSALFLWICRRTAATTQAIGAKQPLPGRTAGAPLLPGRPVILLLLIGFILSASSVVFLKLEPYFAAYILKTTAARSMVMLSIAGGGIASQFCAAWIAARWHVPAAFRLSAVTLTAGAIIFMSVGTQSALWAATAGFIVGFGINGLGMLLWAAVGNFAAASASHPRSLPPTLIFGMLTFSQKSASALATLVIGAVLTLNGILPTAFGTFLPIVVAMSIAPIIGAVICLILADCLKVEH